MGDDDHDVEQAKGDGPTDEAWAWAPAVGAPSVDAAAPELPGRDRAGDGACKPGSAGVLMVSQTRLISLGTNPTKSTTSFRDEVSATHNDNVPDVDL
jgi:hypothetical protein